MMCLDDPGHKPRTYATMEPHCHGVLPMEVCKTFEECDVVKSVEHRAPQS